jgi:hypothetical protein
VNPNLPSSIAFAACDDRTCRHCAGPAWWRVPEVNRLQLQTIGARASAYNTHVETTPTMNNLIATGFRPYEPPKGWADEDFLYLGEGAVNGAEPMQQRTIGAVMTAATAHYEPGVHR